MFGQLASDGYGFHFSDDPSDDPDRDDSAFQRLTDRVVRVKDTTYTFRFILGEFEYGGTQIIGGQAYAGDGSDEKDVVANLHGVLFSVRHPETQAAGYVMAKGLHCVADAVCQEVYDAMSLLFTPKGVPTMGFRNQLAHKGQQHSVVYLSGVFVKESHMGRELGLELTSALLHSLQAEGLWGGADTMAVLCPAGDPIVDNWNSSFTKLSGES